MLGFLNRKALPIGLDLGYSSLKMAQLRVAEQDTLELSAAGAAEVPFAKRADLKSRISFFGSAISHVLKTNAFKSRQCILSVPACHTFLHHVKTPRLSDQELTKILPMELQGKMPFPSDDAMIRHIVAGDIYGDGEGKQEVIIAAVSNQILEQYLDMAYGAGLDVVGVNVECCAVAECFARLFRREEDGDQTVMFIDMGASSTQVILTNGNRMVFARNISYGEQQIDKAVADGMAIPLELAHTLRWDLQKSQANPAAVEELYRYVDGQVETLANEVTQCLRYYESVFRKSVERTVFVGGQAYDKRLCQQLAQRLNLPAQIGDPLARVKRSEADALTGGLDLRQPQPHWAVAVGLSLGAIKAA